VRTSPRPDTDKPLQKHCTRTVIRDLDSTSATWLNGDARRPERVSIGEHPHSRRRVHRKRLALVSARHSVASCQGPPRRRITRPCAPNHATRNAAHDWSRAPPPSPFQRRARNGATGDVAVFRRRRGWSDAQWMTTGGWALDVHRPRCDRRSRRGFVVLDFYRFPRLDRFAARWADGHDRQR